MAQSAAGADCAAAFNEALAGLNAAQGSDVSNAVADLRAIDPVLPGRWIYSQALLGKPVRKIRPPEELRLCIEPIKVAGRIRCRRFGEAAAPAAPEIPTELDISPPPTTSELRLLKAVADLVEGRGAVPDVGNNGRHRWLAQRAASDLKTYISQPQHPAICAGAVEVVEFYANVLKPLQKRVGSVGELVAATRLAANERITSANPASAVGATPDQPPVAVTPADISGVATPVKTLIALVGDAVRPVLGDADVAAILGETTALKALQRAKPALIAVQLDGRANPDPQRAERVLATGRAVRMIEAAAYAEIYAARYAKFDATVIAMPAKIIEAHKRACTCRN